MTYGTLDDFIDAERRFDPTNLVRVDAPVPIDFVMPELVMELERRRQYPVVKFEAVDGYDMPVVSNLFATRDRIARAVDIDPDRFYQEWNERAQAGIPPEIVDDGPVQEVVTRGDELDIQKLPAPRHFEGDGGRYITAGVLVAKHPETGTRNLSYARIQLKGPAKGGISVHSRGDAWEYLKVAEDRAEPLEVAVFIGAHPSLYVGASASPPIDVDEYETIGGVRNEPVRVVPCKTVDLEVPEAAEIVLEGSIDPTEREDEGPFGEYTGFMTGRSTRNVVRFEALTHRRDPTFMSIVPADSMEHLLLAGVPKEPTIFETIRAENPYVTDIALPKAGRLYHCFLAVEDATPAKARQAILSAFGARRYLKLVVAVDDDIDIADEREVLWAIATRVQAAEDVIIAPNAVGQTLDPSSRDGATDKMGIDATRPAHGQYDRIGVPTDVAERVRAMIETELQRGE